MTTVSYALGRPLSATPYGSTRGVLRGGDCRARDLTEGRNIHGPHRFPTTTACQVTNGMLRLTVGATGTAPALTVEAWRGPVVISAEETTTPEWLSMGTLTIDSTLLTAVLSGVRLVRITPEAITVRLIAPVVGDAYVTLRRGEPQVRIQHGSTRGSLVTTNRRVQWTGPPAPTGTTYAGRVQEDTAVVAGIFRYVGALDTATVNAAAFSVNVAGRSTARFGAGVGTAAAGSQPIDLFAQLGDASRPKLVVA